MTHPLMFSCWDDGLLVGGIIHIILLYILRMIRLEMFMSTSCTGHFYVLIVIKSFICRPNFFLS